MATRRSPTTETLTRILGDGLVDALTDRFESGVGPRLSEALDLIEVIGQLSHRHFGASTVVEGDDLLASRCTSRN